MAGAAEQGYLLFQCHRSGFRHRKAFRGKPSGQFVFIEQGAASIPAGPAPDEQLPFDTGWYHSAQSFHDLNAQRRHVIAVLCQAFYDNEFLEMHHIVVVRDQQPV